MQGAAVAQDDSEDGAFRGDRDRAIHYYRKGFLDAALAELEKAVEAPGGTEDYKTNYFLAKVLYDKLIIERAIPSAERAVKLADSDREQSQSKALLKRMSDFFGGVTLTKAPEASSDEGFIHLVDAGGLINTRKKQVFEQMAERFGAKKSKLPVTLYLPFGQYTANRIPFATKKGGVSEILIIPDAESGSSGLAWWVAGAVAVAAAVAVTVILLLPEDQETHTVRIGGQGLPPASVLP